MVPKINLLSWSPRWSLKTHLLIFNGKIIEIDKTTQNSFGEWSYIRTGFPKSRFAKNIFLIKKNLINLINDSYLKQKYKYHLLNVLWKNLSGDLIKKLLVLFYFSLQRHIYVKQDFLIMLQPSQSSGTDSTPHQRIQLFNIVPDIKTICKSRTRNHRSH